MGEGQDCEAAQAQLTQLFALRERLTRDAKGIKAHRSSRSDDSTVEGQQQQPLDYAGALSLVLDFATSAHQAVQSATGKAANAPVPTTSAFEALDFLLLRVKAVLTAGAYPQELALVRDHFSLATLVSLSTALYTTWENQLASAQQRLKSCLSTLLAIVSPSVLDLPQVGQSLQTKVLADSYDSKRGLQVLEVLLRYTSIEDYAAFVVLPSTGAARIDVREGLVRRFIVAMQQNEEMAPVVGKVAMSWIEKCWACAPSNASSEDESWWIRPALAACRHGDARTRHMVATYILNGVFSKRKTAFKEMLIAGGYLFDDASNPASMNEQDLETALAILKTGNALNLVDLDTVSTDDSEKVTSNKVALPTALLSACLKHSSTTLRTSALSLLVLSASSSTLFPLSTFALLRSFYLYSLGEDEGDFRMSTISLTGRLFVRLRDSSWRAHRTVVKGKDGVAKAQEYLDAAQEWITWFLDLVGRVNLDPSRPYRIKMNSLRMLDLALKARVDPRFRLEDSTSTTDSEGKTASSRDATTGYSSYRKGARTQTPTFQAKHRQIREQSSASQDSSHSSTPIFDRSSPSSAVVSQSESGWPFPVDLVNASTTQTLLRQLLSTYTALRHLVIATLERFPAPLPGYEGPAGAERAKRELLLPALRMIRSGREAEASAGAGVIGLVWRKWILESLETASSVDDSAASSFTLGQVGGWQDGSETLSGPRGYAFISSLLDLIEQQLSHYGADLAQAATVAPMHGTLLALRHLFISIPLSALDSLLSSPEERRMLFHRTKVVVQRVWAVTSPVLAARAPEGGAAEADNEEARAIGFERKKAADIGGDVEADDEEIAEGMGGPQHKIILSACWRAMKEAGELLETILRIPSELDTQTFRQVWTYDEIRSIGELFGTWLRLARHRGTVANLHPCYTRSAGALLAAGKDWPEVGKLPEQWLNQHLDDIVSARISITRRSAALPFIILGLLLTILPSSRPTFDAAFTRLFEIAESTTTDITDQSRVHAMNTIRTVFLDAKGGLAAAPYVERGFHVSISLFWSSNWICRNVALLLFATLITRAFNARRTNLDRDPISLTKRLTIDDFFGRYPSLEKVLLTELERAWRESQDADASSNLHSPLFSILMLFSLLQTPRRIIEPCPSQSSTPSHSAAFLPIVKACAKSRVWKIRDAAGDALTGLVAPNEVAAIALELLRSIEAERALLSYNELHGRLVQVQRLLDANVLLPEEEEQQVAETYSRLVALILPPSVNASGPLRPAFPYAILSTFLRIAIRLPSVLASSSSPLQSLSFSYLEQAERWVDSVYHLPSAEEFLRSSWQVLFALAASKQEKLALAQGGLQARSIEVQRAALAALQELGPDALPTAELLERVVLDAKFAGDVRVLAAELVRSLGEPGRDTGHYEAYATLYQQTPIVPLREAVLPLLAGSAAGEAEQHRVLELLRPASDVDESVESRESASLALIALSRAILPPALKSRYLHLAIRLIQDDDPVVRENAELAFGARLVEGKAVEQALEAGGKETLSLLREEEAVAFQRDLDALANPTSLLFAVEKPNIFIDCALLDSLLHKSLATPASDPTAMSALAELDEATRGLNEGPLGTSGNELVSRWARVWIQQLDEIVLSADASGPVKRLRGSA